MVAKSDTSMDIYINIYIYIICVNIHNVYVFSHTFTQNIHASIQQGSFEDVRGSVAYVEGSIFVIRVECRQ